MPAPKLAQSVLLVVCAGGLAACGDHYDRGPTTTETRQVGAFDSINMEGAARLEITVGKPESLVIVGNSGSVARVQTEVRDDTLYIKSKPKDWVTHGTQRLKLKITVPKLASLRLEGGNDVRLRGFDGGQSDIRAAGAAHIKADGQLDELTVRMSGAGHADFSKLVAKDARVTVDGVGSIIVHPKDTLEATMNGVGAIFYTGNPHDVNTRMNGLGTIGRRDANDITINIDDDDDDEEQATDRPHGDQPAVDPKTLQPEYEKPGAKQEDVQKPARRPASDSTEVI